MAARASGALCSSRMHHVAATYTMALRPHTLTLRRTECPKLKETYNVEDYATMNYVLMSRLCDVNTSKHVERDTLRMK